MEQYSRGRRGRTRNAIGRVTAARVQIPAAPLYIPVSAMDIGIFLFSGQTVSAFLSSCNRSQAAQYRFCIPGFRITLQNMYLIFLKWPISNMIKTFLYKSFVYTHLLWYFFKIFPRTIPIIIVHIMANIYIWWSDCLHIYQTRIHKGFVRLA